MHTLLIKKVEKFGLLNHLNWEKERKKCYLSMLKKKNKFKTHFLNVSLEFSWKKFFNHSWPEQASESWILENIYLSLAQKNWLKNKNNLESTQENNKK